MLELVSMEGETDAIEEGGGAEMVAWQWEAS